MHLFNVGMLANQYWMEIPLHFARVRLGAHVVMPNHVHGILILESAAVETLHCNVSTTNTTNQFMSDISPKPGSVSTIVHTYKSACTNYINKQFSALNFGWQERFHDHIIRNETEYARIENYIVNNPANWVTDKFFPENQTTAK